jgi:hypothetical protein
MWVMSIDVDIQARHNPIESVSTCVYREIDIWESDLLGDERHGVEAIDCLQGAVV